MKRKQPNIFVLFMLVFCLNASGKNKKDLRPNILFIMVDDLGWKDVGYMGSKYYETPNIDKLAASGVIFNNAYAAAANCAPSRACVMSGYNTPRHGIYTVGSSERGKSHTRKLIPTPNTTILADSIQTLAERLKLKGYKTAHMGKWHLGEDPCSQGFDVNIAGSHAGHPKSYFSPYKNLNLEDGPEGEYLTDRLTSEAIKFIQEASQKNKEPFFLYLPYFTVHTPLQGKNKLIQKYKRKEGIGGQGNAVYAAMVESADENIGRLLQALKSSGIEDNTLVVFTSDNGGIANISSQYPLRAGKGSYYEGGIRVPFILRWPNGFPAGKIYDTHITGLDVKPTILDIVGEDASCDKLLDGESLLPLIKSNQPLSREALFWHFPIYLQKIHPINDQARDPLFRTRPGSVIRMGKYKLHEYFEDGALELYDLESDIGERVNLVKIKPDIAKLLYQKLVEWRETIKAPVPCELNPNYLLKNETLDK
jgi:arylsulfatase A-like enzyme